MRHFTKGSAILLFFLGSVCVVSAQMTPWFQWTFLPAEQLDYLIGEASGETAFGHTLQLAGQPRDRQPSEYSGIFPEAQYVLDRAKEYALADAVLLRYPGEETWDGVRGELWETSPGRQKLASYTDQRAMLTSGSNPANVTAELVWVGDGDAKEFEKVDVVGKIVLTSGPVSRVHKIACLQNEAAGVISYYSPRPLVDPLIIPWGQIEASGGRPARFAFQLTPREGSILRDRLLQGEKIIAHALVDSSRQKADWLDVVASIPGSDPMGDEIILSAHLFEGFVMQGANDNVSGSAALLETARILQKLIQEGRLPKPRRTIRFIWVPEYAGTIPYVKAHQEQMKRTLCNINLDMVGLDLFKSKAFLTLIRTTYGNAHFVNDVLENFLRYVAEANHAYIANSFLGTFSRRIVAPSGSEEPMLACIGTHFGSSDHEVFGDWGVGVPGVMLNTWPDPWIHTSEDRPDKLDPTQLKRAVVITAASAYTIACANDDMAARMAAEIVSNASARLGHQLARGLQELQQSGNDEFPSVYKKVRGYLEATSLNEQATLDTLQRLAADPARFSWHLEKMKTSIREIANAQLQVMENQMESESKSRQLNPVSLDLSPIEKKAATLIAKPTTLIKANSYRGYRESIQKACNPEQKTLLDQGDSKIFAEIQLLCKGRMTALDIKKMIDTQFREETPLEKVLSHLELLKAAGLVTF
jgi:aminopeptidase YwaD